MLSNCVALEIIDNKYRIIISEPKEHNIQEAYALRAYWNGDMYAEKGITLSNEFEDISKLFNKATIIDYDEER